MISGNEKRSGGFPPLSPFCDEQLQATKPIRSPRRRAVSDQLYLLLQVWLITVLTVVDSGQFVIQHPGWFQ
jgi:hypothetical protein